eukprot:6146615-Amphidinium_carterae.2
MTPDQQWSRELFNATEVPMMDTTMKPDYSEEAVIGRAIIDQYFSKVRLNTKQPGHTLTREETAPERVLVSEGSPEKEGQNDAPPESVLCPGEVQPPPRLDVYVRPTSKALAKPAAYRPTHRLIGKQTPPIVAQLEELRLKNNEDEQEKNRMESTMDNIQAQPWWQYEDEVTRYNVKDIH